MASKLTNLSPVTICGEVLPPPQLIQNIPILHWILQEVLEDWLRAVKPYQAQVDSVGDNSVKEWAVGPGFMELQPALLKSLFSYAFFFAAADNAYANFYKDLNRANHLSGLNLKHRKPPTKNSFVKKIGMIRDIAIAHIPSDKANPLDAWAAMSWQPMALSWSHGDQPDLEQLTFAPLRFHARDTKGRTIQSRDLEVPGLKVAHFNHCLPYLERFDKVCREYLQALDGALG